MPKKKTNKSAAKRFSVTGTGKVKRNRAYHRHLLSKKSRDRKRLSRKSALVHKGQERTIKSLLDA